MPWVRLARELTTGGSTPGKKMGKFPLVGHTHMHPVHVDHAKGKRDGLGPPKTSLRSMDREHESTMSHVVWADLWTKAQWRP